ncbi:nucleotidyltransferase family protein [Sulfuricurvum sp.]|jgi:predicted nucleotidyltransferase|uniref:nucleotidyltransferase family protein n=1 Tax=Sulfuricurvum sp. TaxID=2025608 RepID=UPI003BB590E9
MTKEDISQKLKLLKPKYENEGFILLGFFGSYARDEANEQSDIDILYKIKDINQYLQKYNGWNAINHIVDTKEALKRDFQKEIDFVDVETLNAVGKKYILADVVNV